MKSSVSLGTLTTYAKIVRANVLPEPATMARALAPFLPMRLRRLLPRNPRLDCWRRDFVRRAWIRLPSRPQRTVSLDPASRHPMSVRLVSVEAEAFRGFGARVIVPLDADAVIVTGSNGVGKTTLVDAICWP